MAVVVLMRRTAAVVAVIAGGLVSPPAAQATPLFVGSYAATETPAGQPDQNGTWIVQSSCLTLGCLAHVYVTKSQIDFNMMFDGNQWNRVAVPPAGTCNGVSVIARSAHEILVPQADGSLTGASTSTVDCGGTSVDLSLPLRLTPA